MSSQIRWGSGICDARSVTVSGVAFAGQKPKLQQGAHHGKGAETMLVNKLKAVIAVTLALGFLEIGASLGSVWP